jgi:hypothetical protein
MLQERWLGDRYPESSGQPDGLVVSLAKNGSKITQKGL